MFRAAVFFSLLLTFVSSCTSNDSRQSNTVDPGLVYFDYRVSGDEESGIITVKLQYRIGNSNGATLALTEPSKVEFDGQRLEMNSSKLSGSYYEISLPIADFTGPHQIVFTDSSQRIYRENLEFQVIYLKNPLPDSIRREDLVFEIGGLRAQDQLQVLLTDTSFYSKGIDRVDSVRNGRVFIARDELDNLRNGPIQLEFYKEEDRPLKQAPKKGGRLMLSYGLKRVFQLTD